MAGGELEVVESESAARGRKSATVTDRRTRQLRAAQSSEKEPAPSNRPFRSYRNTEPQATETPKHPIHFPPRREKCDSHRPTLQGFGFGEPSEIAGDVEFGAVGHGVVRGAISGSISHGGGL